MSVDIISTSENPYYCYYLPREIISSSYIFPIKNKKIVVNDNPLIFSHNDLCLGFTKDVNVSINITIYNSSYLYLIKHPDVLLSYKEHNFDFIEIQWTGLVNSNKLLISGDISSDSYGTLFLNIL